MSLPGSSQLSVTCPSPACARKGTTATESDAAPASPSELTARTRIWCTTVAAKPDTRTVVAVASRLDAPLAPETPPPPPAGGAGERRYKLPQLAVAVHLNRETERREADVVVDRASLENYEAHR